jgi:hypothetical protein
VAQLAVRRLSQEFHGHWRFSYILFDPFSTREELLHSLKFLFDHQLHVPIRKLFSRLLVFEKTLLKRNLESKGFQLIEGPVGVYDYEFVEPSVQDIWKRVRWFEGERAALMSALSGIQNSRGDRRWVEIKGSTKEIRRKLWALTFNWLGGVITNHGGPTDAEAATTLHKLASEASNCLHTFEPTLKHFTNDFAAQ